MLFFIQINSAAAADDDDDYYYGWMVHVVSWESHKQRSDGVNALLRVSSSPLWWRCVIIEALPLYILIYIHQTESSDHHHLYYYGRPKMKMMM